MTENPIIRKQTDAVWSSISRRLKENITKINAELEEDHLHLDVGNIIGIVKVWSYDSELKNMNTVGFELIMNTGGLSAWYQENMIRWSLPVHSIIDRDTNTLLIRYEGESVSAEDLVDRVINYLLEKTKK